MECLAISPGVASFAAVLLPRLQVGQVLLPLLRFPPDPPVEEAHDGHRNVERRDRRAEGDVMVRLQELYVALVLLDLPLALDVGPAVDPRRPQQQAYAPGTPGTRGTDEARASRRSWGVCSPDHDAGPVGGASRAVRQGSGDGEVPVEADDEEVEHRSVAGQVVEGEPGVADKGAQGPVAQQGEDGEEGHRDQTDSEVGDGERE